MNILKPHSHRQATLLAIVGFLMHSGLTEAQSSASFGEGLVGIGSNSKQTFVDAAAEFKTEFGYCGGMAGFNFRF